jgi:hypothetical protein
MTGEADVGTPQRYRLHLAPPIDVVEPSGVEHPFGRYVPRVIDHRAVLSFGREREARGGARTGTDRASGHSSDGVSDTVRDDARLSVVKAGPSPGGWAHPTRTSASTGPSAPQAIPRARRPE